MVTGLKGGLVTITATCNGKNADMDKPASVSVQVNVKGIEGNYQYVINNGTITIDKYLGDETSIIIPSTIDGMPVTNIESYSFAFASNGKSIVSVKIPNGVTKISDYAFNACTRLSSVFIPSSVTSIGQRAFWNTAPPSIVIPEGVTTIGKEAFALCSDLESVTLPSSFKTIGERAFAYTNLKEVIIPEGVTSIGRNAFNGCRQLEKVTLPSTLKYINPLAFTSTGLKTIVLPNNITYIGTNALKGIETIIVNPGSTTEQTLKESGISYSYPLFELNQIPVIECEDITISLNASFDPLEDVKAMDAENGDLTKDIVILDNNVDVSKEGEYTIVYEVKDSQGASCQKIRKVKVIKETITKEETKTKDKTIKKSNVSIGAFSSLALNISLLLSSLGSLILFKRRK